ncbi:type VII secretion integral membrane protein EccD [Frankia sp. EI5c]|nr:type VII secretion integral membrane protein EccD [Frankia sp. EI5c]
MGQTSLEVCRLVIVGPTSQVDLAVPTQVPLADLMPALLNSLGRDLADQGLEHGGWVIQPLGAAPLDEDRTVTDHSLLDGDTLYLRPRSDQLPPLDFDDLIDGVATGMRTRAGRWRPRTTRVTGLVTLAGLLVALLAVPPLSGRGGGGAAGHGWAAPLAVVATILFALTCVVGRTTRDDPLTVIVGIATVAGAVECAVLAVLDTPTRRGDPELAALVLAGTVVGLLVALLLPLAARGPDALLRLAAGPLTVAAAAFLAVWVHSTAGLTWTAVAAILLVATVAVRPGVPMAGFKLAGMALPPVPVEPDELQDDIDPEPGPLVLARTAAADRHMTVLHLACGLVGGVALGVLATAPGWVAPTLAALAAGAQLLALRPMTSAWHRFALGIPAGGGLLAVVLALVPGPGAAGDQLALWLLLGLVLVCVALVPVLARRRITPIWGRVGDWAHVCALVAAVPLVASVLGGISWVRSVVG